MRDMNEEPAMFETRNDLPRASRTKVVKLLYGKR